MTIINTLNHIQVSTLLVDVHLKHSIRLIIWPIDKFWSFKIDIDKVINL